MGLCCAPGESFTKPKTKRSRTAEFLRSETLRYPAEAWLKPGDAVPSVEKPMERRHNPVFRFLNRPLTLMGAERKTQEPKNRRVSGKRNFALPGSHDGRRSVQSSAAVFRRNPHVLFALRLRALGDISDLLASVSD